MLLEEDLNYASKKQLWMKIWSATAVVATFGHWTIFKIFST